MTTMTNRAVFLDMQGTLGGDAFGDIRDFTFFPFAIAAIRLLNESGVLAIVITNQTRISRGLLTIEFFWDRIGSLRDELGASGAHLDAVYCCPHQDSDNCNCKKPKPGLVLQAQRDHHLDLESCYVVGDLGKGDMTLARSVGCKAVLVLTGAGETSLGEFRHTWADISPDFVAEDVLAAVKWILSDIKEIPRR